MMNSARSFSASLWFSGRHLADPRLSPRKASISFITGGGERAELAILSAVGRPEEWLPLDPAIKRGAGGYVWLPDDSGLVYSAVDGHIYCYEFESMAVRAITVAPEPISNLALSPNGEHLAYVVDMQRVMTTPMTTPGEPVCISSGADFAFDPSWSHDSNVVAWHEWDVPDMPWDGGRIVARSISPDAVSVTVAGGDDISVQQPRFSPDGRYLTFLSDANGWLNLWVADADLSNPRPLIEEAFEHAPPAWGPGQRSYCWVNGSDGIIFARNERGMGTLQYFDLTTRRAVPIADATFTALSSSGSHVVGLSTGPMQNQRIDLIDLRERANTTVAQSGLSGLERAGVVPEQVSWHAADGETVHGRLYRTRLNRTRLNRTMAHYDGDLPPLIVWLHGGPAAQSPATLHARWHYFLQRGWSVLVVDYRGSTGWGRAYAQALRGRWAELDVTDTASGVEAAIANQWGDSRRIVVMGASSAGTTSLLLLAQRSELFAAGIVIYPMADFLDFEHETWRFEAHYLERLLGPFPLEEQVYLQRTPINHVAKISKPVLLLHGESDDVIPVRQSLDLYERMEQAGCTVEFHIYEGEGHGWKKPSTQIDELERIEAFLHRYVLHGELDTRNSDTREQE